LGGAFNNKEEEKREGKWVTKGNGLEPELGPRRGKKLEVQALTNLAMIHLLRKKSPRRKGRVAGNFPLEEERRLEDPWKEK